MDRNEVVDVKDKKAEAKPIVIFPINANPPHIGHIIAINMLLNVASHVIVLLYDEMQVCSPEQARYILSDIFNQYVEKDRIEILVSKTNFANTNEIPKILTDRDIPFTVATTSKHIYSNMKSKGYPYMVLLNRPIGWRDEFFRIAYIRSIVLGQIEDSKWTKQIDKLVKEV